jgi:hypothetical protein
MSRQTHGIIEGTHEIPCSRFRKRTVTYLYRVFDDFGDLLFQGVLNQGRVSQATINTYSHSRLVYKLGSQTARSWYRTLKGNYREGNQLKTSSEKNGSHETRIKATRLSYRTRWEEETTKAKYRTNGIDWRCFRDFINPCIVHETRNRTCREASLLSRFCDFDFPDLCNARIDPAVLAWPNRVLVDVLEDNFVACLRLQEQRVSGSTKVERSNWVSRIDIPQRFSNLASGHLPHSDPDESNPLEVNLFVRLDDVHGAGGDDAEPGLRTNQGTVRITWFEICIIRGGAIIGESCIVTAVKVVARHDFSCDGAVPTVIVLGTEERLINRSAFEILCEWSQRTRLFATEYVVERVILLLEPEGVMNLDIPSDTQDGGLAGIVDECAILCGGLDGAHFIILEFSSKEAIPRVVFRIVGMIDLVGLIKCLSAEARLQDGESLFVEPPIFIGVKRLGRIFRLQVLPPGIQQIFDRFVEIRVREQDVSSGGVTDEIKDEIHRESDRLADNDVVRSLSLVEPGRRFNDIVEMVQEVFPVFRNI